MSDWYLTTEDKIKSMSVIAWQEIVIRRRDLLQFLTLPPGYTFETLPEINAENGQCW